MCWLERGLNDYSFAGTRNEDYGGRDPVKISFEEWAKPGGTNPHFTITLLVLVGRIFCEKEELKVTLDKKYEIWPIKI